MTPSSEPIDRFLDGHLAFRPSFAIGLGLHAYDGKVPDRSPAAVAAEIGAFHDELLRYGEAPLTVTRRMMLGPDAGPPLAKQR